MTTPETRFVRSGDADIAYQVFGSGPRELVAIPGWISHLEVMWELAEFGRFLERLAELGRVVMYDKRGTGMSDRPPNRVPLEEHIIDLRRVLDAAGMARPSIIAWVDACAIAAGLAASTPDRVEALVLGSFVAKAAAGVDPETVRSFTRAIEESWGEGITAPLVAPSLADDDRFRRWYGRWERLSATPRAAAEMQEWSMELDIGDILGAVRCPTLVLHRRGIAVVPLEEVRRAAALIPTARLVELEGADLYPIVGDADAVLDEIEEFLTGVRPAVRSDRVLATVLFTDIVGSTDRARELGDRRWQDLLEAHHATVRRELDHFGGTEMNTAGDGFLATFEGPARAVRCACAIRDAVRELGLEIRAGVHTGEIERSESDVSGIAVHVGARVMSSAGDSEVWTTQTVKDLVLGSGIEFADRGEHALKGVPGAWRLYAVTSC